MSSPIIHPGVGDIVSGVAIAVSWGMVVTGYAAPIFAVTASAVAIIFYCIQIYDSRIVQGVLKRRRESRISALTIEIARLKAKADVVSTTIDMLKNK